MGSLCHYHPFTFGVLNMLTEWLETLDDDAREYFEERAAILEFDGGLSRSDAEIEAQRLTQLYLDRQ
jgi:hypothetical protein